MAGGTASGVGGSVGRSGLAAEEVRKELHRSLQFLAGNGAAGGGLLIAQRRGGRFQPAAPGIQFCAGRDQQIYKQVGDQLILEETHSAPELQRAPTHTPHPLARETRLVPTEETWPLR